MVVLHEQVAYEVVIYLYETDDEHQRINYQRWWEDETETWGEWFIEETNVDKLPEVLDEEYIKACAKGFKLLEKR